MMDYSDLIGKPYKTGARGPDAFDCWGLVIEAARRAGIELPDIDVPQDNDIRGDIIEIQKATNFKRTLKPESNCLVLFRIIDDENHLKWHVGFILNNARQFIHTTGKMGVNISRLNDPKWKIHTEGFYRYEPNHE
jgi:hypothetical protein